MSHVDVGLANISRSLEKMSSNRNGAETGAEGAKEPASGSSRKPYAVVFVARSGQPSAFHSHFPQMVATASSCLPADQYIRLVGFSKACEDRLSSCLAIPRVSSVALRQEAPQSTGLIDFVRETVPAIEIPWLQEAKDASFLPTKINSLDATVGLKRSKP
jgi:ribonuclease P/MRP protein subunit POP3